MEDNIYVIEIWNDSEEFSRKVNECLREGYKVSSTNCGVNTNGVGTYDTVYQAILISETGK